MATFTTRQRFAGAGPDFPGIPLLIRNDQGSPARVDGEITVETSDATVATGYTEKRGEEHFLYIQAGGAPGGPATLTGTGDADLGSGFRPITFIVSDINATLDPADEATTITIGDIGEPSPIV